MKSINLTFVISSIIFLSLVAVIIYNSLTYGIHMTI